MIRAHLEEEPRVLLQLVRRPVVVRGGAPQGAEELERDQHAVEGDAGSAAGNESQVLSFPACDGRVGQQVL